MRKSLGGFFPYAVAPLVASIALPGVACGEVSGQAAAWGFGANGALGNGSSADNSVPVMPLGLASGVTAISAGNAGHAVAIQNGAAYSWGLNAVGELGNGEDGITKGDINLHSEVPVAVVGLSSDVTAVSAGGGYSLAIQNGAVYTWGERAPSYTLRSNVPFPVPGLGSGVTTIAASGGHALAAKSGIVYAWGGNSYGQLGDGTFTDSEVPVPVVGLTSATAISAGREHSLALQNGAAYAWGLNQYGQLGVGSLSNSNLPHLVLGLTSGVSAVAAGDDFSLAIKNGYVYAWGTNSNGQLGNGTQNLSNTLPLLVPGLPSNFVAVAASDYSSYALTADGELWAWGNNGNGQLALGTSGNIYLTPQHVAAPQGYRFAAIEGGSFFAVGILVPVPEPASPALFILGSTTLLLRRRKNKERHSV